MFYFSISKMVRTIESPTLFLKLNPISCDIFEETLPPPMRYIFIFF